MANIKITDLTAYTDAASTDVLPIVDVTADVTKKIAIGDIVKAVPAGTGALPGLAFDGDPDTGLSSPDLNKLALSTAGTGRLFIDANGKVGIGVSNPSDYTNYANDLVITDPGGGATGISINITGNTGYSSVYFGDSDAGGAGAIQYGHFVDDVMYFTVGGNTRCAITSTGQIQSAGLGTAGTPAFSFSTDPNTGIYSPGADQVAISTNGTGRLFVDASGNVGLNTTPSAPLDLYGVNNSLCFRIDGGAGVSDRAFRIGNSSNSLIWDINSQGGASGNGELSFSTNSQERLRITSDGKLGLGTSAPQRLLTTKIDSNGAGLLLYRSSEANNDYGGIEFGNHTNDIVNQRKGAIYFVSDGRGYGRGSIYICNDGAGDTGNVQPSDAQIVVRSTGEVGIGTTSPALPLHVVGAIASRNTTAGMDNMSIQFVETGSGNAYGVRIGQKANATLAFEKYDGGWGETARIDSSGRLLVGTSSSAGAGERVQIVGTDYVSSAINITRTVDSIAAPSINLTKTRSGTYGTFGIVSSGDIIGNIYFRADDGTNYDTVAASISAFVDGTPGADDMPGRLVFSTTADGSSSPTERMRITSGGYLKAAYDGSYINATASYHEFTGNSANSYDFMVRNDEVTPLSQYIVELKFNSSTPNDSNARFIDARDATAGRFYVLSNGGIGNYQSNDSNLCDEREKKNIETLDSTWSCLKHWDLKKFHYNEDADTDDKRYGVIAQQIAPHCPELITDWVKQKAEDAVLDEDGNVVTPAVEEVTRMGVKEQQMMWMAIKALQEAQTRIETLEAEVAALKA